MTLKFKELLHELKHHSPFTALASVTAILVVLIIIYLIKIDISKNIFEIAHPLHVLVSGIATAGVFYKYKKNISQVLFVGIIGSIVIGSISDVIFPYIGGLILNIKTQFHLPIIENTITILSSALIGSVIGVSTKFTRMPHFLHVFLSVFASLFYLLAFSATFVPLSFILVFIIVFIAVIVPCCMSDIVFPFFFLGEKIKHCNCK